ncbi:putative quinol monooxygenase [Marinomonas epiphytica]
MFVVTVTFKVAKADAAEFETLMLKQAQDSLEIEPECDVFEVSKSELVDSTVVFFLYEVYHSAESFNQHLDSEHFVSFSENVQNMVLDKTVHSWHRLN